MSSDAETLQRKTEQFLREFFAKGESLVRELIEENDRLKSRLDTPEPSAVAVDETMVEHLLARVSLLERECDEIKRMAGKVEMQSGDYRERLRALEQEHYDLACQYVAGTQFQAATTLDDVLRTVTELLLNFVGVGRFTLYTIDEERQVLFPVAREGGSPRDLPEITLSEPPFSALVALGHPWTASDGYFTGGEGGDLMTLPLVSGSRLMGVARLEGFFQQKHEFAPGDHGLLSLISERAGAGFETAWIRAHAREAPLQREAIEHLVGA